MHDVIVVGGGPVGCYTASLLAQKGFDTLVLEGNPSVGHRVICTGLIGVEAFERFHLARGSVISQIQDVTFISPSGICFSYRPDSPRAFLVDRHQFDRDMAAMAQSFGAKLRCGSPVTNVTVREDGVVVEAEGPGRNSDFRARMVVIACGFNPELTGKLGLESPAECLHGGQVELDVDGVTETEIYVGREVAPESFAWVVPIGSGKARIGMTTRENADLFLSSFLNHPMLRDRIEHNGAEISVSTIPIRPIPKSFMTRTLVVGEAAGQVKSTTCGGIYYGLISARLAAQTIEEAFSEGRFEDVTLGKYEQRWRRELGGELEVGYRFRQIFSGIDDNQIDRLFRILNSDGIAPLIHRKAEFDWHKDLILVLSRHSIFRKCLYPVSAFGKRSLSSNLEGTHRLFASILAES